MSVFFVSEFFFENDGKIILPEMYLFFGLLWLLFFGTFFATQARYRYPILFTCIGRQLGLVFFFTGLLFFNSPFTNVFFFNSHFFFTPEDIYVNVCLLFFSSLFLFLVSETSVLYNKSIVQIFEFFILIGFSVFGLFFLISANDTVVFYLCLEVQSFCLYILSSLHKDNIRSTEAGLKYFLLGAVSSGVLLFGLALLYGFFGTTNLSSIKQLCSSFFFSNDISFLALFGFFFFFVGLLFKIGVAPFHIWVADVYSGIPFISLLFVATVPKIAFFFVVYKFYFSFLSFFGFFFAPMVLVSVCASVFIGSVGALLQNNIRRFIAYSSINHAGVLLLSVYLPFDQVYNVLFFYVTVYCLMLFGFFLFLNHLYGFAVDYGKQSIGIQKFFLTDLKGVFSFYPIVSFFFSISLFSFAGIPPLAGFFTKIFMFFVLLSESLYVVLWFIFFASLISVFYYFRFVKIVFFDKYVFTNSWICFVPMTFFNAWVLVFIFFVLLFLCFVPDFFFLLFCFLVSLVVK